MTRRIIFCLLALWLMTLIRAEGEVPECENIPEEKMAQLRSLVVKEDVHDKLVGDFSELWMSKVFLEEKEYSCVRYTRSRVNDTVLYQHLEAKGLRFPFSNSTLEKVANGIYLVRRVVNDELMAKMHVLYADDRAVAYFGCGLIPTSPGDSRAKTLSLLTRVSVRAGDLRTVLEPETQAAVEAAVKRVRDHQDLLGEIVFNNLAC